MGVSPTEDLSGISILLLAHTYCKHYSHHPTYIHAYTDTHVCVYKDHRIHIRSYIANICVLMMITTSIIASQVYIEAPQQLYIHALLNSNHVIVYFK